MTDMEETSRARLTKQVAKVVAGLRRIADQVEREAARDILDAAGQRHEWSTYTGAVSRIEHQISWGVANLHVSSLIQTAGDADRAQVEKPVS